MEKGYIERLNAATNLIGFVLVLVGAVLCISQPNIGASVITGAFGLIAGKALSDAAK